MSAWKLGLALGATLAGCIDPVTLGRECAERVGSCVDIEPPGPPLQAMDASVDARVLDAESDAAISDAGDAGSALVAPDVGPPPLAVALTNGQFELTNGSYGGIALQPFDPIPIGANLVSPWVACGIGLSVRDRADSMRNSGAGDVLPREGAGFVEAEVGIGVGALRQDLSTPLKAGERYAFRIDARVAVGSSVTLEVWGSNVDCVTGSKLAELGMVSESWSSPCVSFVAPADFSQLMLLSAIRGTSSGSPRIFYDALRNDPSCD